MKLFEIIVREIERGGVADQNGSICEFSTDTEKLFEVFINKLLDFEVIDKKSCFEKSEIYNTAISFMNDNIEKNLTLEDIARHCGICKTTLKNIFSERTGMGAVHYFTELKIQQAKKRLLSGEKCSKVSEELGFSSQAYFSRRYKEICGISPSQTEQLPDK